jgi:hypothetical protein
VIDFWGIGYTVAGRMCPLPDTILGSWFRNQATLLVRLPLIADWLIGRSVAVKDDLDLPAYDLPDPTVMVDLRPIFGSISGPIFELARVRKRATMGTGALLRSR